LERLGVVLARLAAISGAPPQSAAHAEEQMLNSTVFVTLYSQYTRTLTFQIFFCSPQSGVEEDFGEAEILESEEAFREAEILKSQAEYECFVHKVTKESTFENFFCAD